MTENYNNLIIKYEVMLNEEYITKSFILNEEYTNKFKNKPINEYEMMYSTCNGYDTGYINIKLYFMKDITKQTYDIIKELQLTDDENEIMEIINEN